MNIDIQIEKLPASVDAERSILGAIMLENHAFYEANAVLDPSDFSLDSHRRIYARVAELMEAGVPVDVVTLTEQLAQKREIEAVGGVAYVSSLTEGVPRRPSIEQYVRIVRGKSQLRQLIHLSTRTISMAAEQEDSPNTILEDVHAELVNILAKSQRENEAEYLAQFSDRAWQRLQELKKRVGLIGLSTGIDGVNEKTGGIRPSEFWLLGARTSDGKTVVAVQAAINNAQRFVDQGIDASVGFFAIEMSKEQVLERIWAQLCLKKRLPVDQQRIQENPRSPHPEAGGRNSPGADQEPSGQTPNHHRRLKLNRYSRV
jgi:replicative DNA helicase